jgi:hypothetical protein
MTDSPSEVAKKQLDELKIKTVQFLQGANMARPNVEVRLTAIETELASLKKQVQFNKETNPDWLDSVWGSFSNDPMYDEAMELGRKYRESLRPKEKATPKRSARSTK